MVAWADTLVESEERCIGELEALLAALGPSDEVALCLRDLLSTR